MALALVVALAPAAGRAAPPPLALYGQLPNIGTIALSPDGSRWAAIMGDETAAQIQVRSLPDNRLLSVTPADKAKLRDLDWVGNDHLVATISTTREVPGLSSGRREWFQLIALDLAGARNWRPLLQNVERAMNVAAGPAVGLVDGDGARLVVPGIYFAGPRGQMALLRVPLGSGSARVTEQGNVDTVQWLVGDDGRAAARVDYAQDSGEWRLFLRQPGGSLRRVYTETAPIDRPFLRSFGRDQDHVAVATHRSGTWRTHEVALADGSWSDPLPDYDRDAVIVDPRRRTAIGTRDETLAAIRTRFFAPANQALWAGIERAFPGERVRLESWSDDRAKVIVAVEGAKDGAALYLVDRKAGQAGFLADRYAGLEPGMIAPVTTLSYRAGDGLPIPAYLTLPPGRPAQALPLVVLAHGGPAARDRPEFDWWAQALASRGYAVLQPQFRGSTGFGEAHLAAGFGEWGRKMQSDLADGVRFLAAKGTIDPNRVCIVGASYGGYAAMAGVTVDQGVYRCASAVAGVADLRRMLRSEIRDTGGSNNATLRYWRRFMGAAGDSDPALDAISPARLAARVTVPLQLIHGEDDTVVPFAQSRLMAEALTAAGRPTEVLVLPGEDHWLSRAKTRIAMLAAQVAFLERHNPPDAAPAGR